MYVGGSKAMPELQTHGGSSTAHYIAIHGRKCLDVSPVSSHPYSFPTKINGKAPGRRNDGRLGARSLTSYIPVHQKKENPFIALGARRGFLFHEEGHLPLRLIPPEGDF